MMLSTMSSEYTITEGPYNLKEVASKVKLPQVVLVTQGFYGATDKDTISGEQVMVAFFVKRVKGVTGIHKKRSFHIPFDSAMQFAPVPLEGVQDTYETVACIFEKEPTPAVVAIVNMTQDAHGQVVRPGTILFPRRCEKALKTKRKNFRKNGGMANAEFTTTLGTKIHLPMDCAASFSTQVKDVKLYLPELVAHLTLPVEVKCFAQERSRHCNKMSNITLTKVCTEASITGGLTLEGSKAKDHLFDLPLDLPVQVACIDLAKKDLQQSLYARVKSTYESVDHRLAANKTIIVNGDARDKAQQEFYSAVRTDIAQDVVTVDVPERIYDEVDFGNGNRTSTVPEGVQCSNSVGACAVPKQPLPPLPPPRIERSKDEPCVQLMRDAPANASFISTPSAPLPCRKHDVATVPAAVDIYDDATAPQSSINAPHTDRDAASKMLGLGNPTAALSVPPPLPAQAKQKKCTPPPLHGKPLQPVLHSPPKAFPQRQGAVYEEICPDTLTASVYTPLVHANPTRPPPGPLPKPAPSKTAHTHPQLQVQAEGSNPSQVDEVGNIEYLMTLSCNDIIRLLEAMELPQYIDNFMKEHIDGELLSSMTDEELQEVGVMSSLHRKRFIKVIAGRHSAEQLLECGNPYASISSHS